jgi:pyridoxine 4-dehydrogenase
LRGACEGSLERLRLEQIPVYQLHRVDPAVPLEESMGMLVTLKDEGKIRHIGVSNFSDEQLDRALAITSIVSVQNRYGRGDRSSEAIIDRCETEGLAFLPWAPFDGGPMSDAVVERIAGAHGVSPRQVVLAWLLARSPVMLPIPGTGSVAHLEQNVAARDVQLTSDDLADLDRV